MAFGHLKVGFIIGHFTDLKILPSKLNIGVMKPSKVPKAEPRPSVNNIKKNKTAQNGPPGITAMASATAMKAKPVPENVLIDV